MPDMHSLSYCSHCGNLLNLHVRFCSLCGSPIAAAKRSLNPMVITLIVVGLGILSTALALAVADNGSAEKKGGEASRTDRVAEGQIYTFRGKVTESGVSIFGRLPYVQIENGPYSVKCYTSEDVRIGSMITITGKVTAWVNGRGGSLR